MADSANLCVNSGGTHHADVLAMTMGNSGGTHPAAVTGDAIIIIIIIIIMVFVVIVMVP